MEVQLRARVGGFLLDWRKNFEEGRAVTNNQTLFEIRPDEFRAALASAQAELVRAEARLSRAQEEAMRLEQAAAGGAATPREKAVAETERLQAQADVDLQKARVEARQIELSYATIKAPFDGIIGRAEKDAGAVVDTAQNSLLATVSRLNPIYANFSFSERDFVRWKADVESGRVIMQPGTPLVAEIRLIDGTEYPLSGMVDFADVRIDQSTGNARVRATFANPSFPTPRGSDHVLKPGQAITGRIVGWQRPNTIVVPQAAVIQSATGAFVYTLNAENAVEVQPVTLGQWVGESGWQIDAGLSPGMRVIVDGAMKVQPKLKVNASPMPPRPPVQPLVPKPTTGPVSRPSEVLPTPTTQAGQPAPAGTTRPATTGPAGNP
jgi:membrane fusion protein (multidrug efflux system)